MPRNTTVLTGPNVIDEAFRVARSNLMVALSDLDSPSVIVTSAQPGEGKTMTCANLAVSLARAGQRVVLVDLDMRAPGLHSAIGGFNEIGLADVLVEREKVEDCIQLIDLGRNARDERVGLYFLAAGTGVASPTELVGSARMPRLLDSLAREADVVLLDCPPVLPMADTLVVGRMAAGAVLVVEARRTPYPLIEQAKNALTRNQTRLLGVILNKMRDGVPEYRYGYALDDG